MLQRLNAFVRMGLPAVLLISMAAPYAQAASRTPEITVSAAVSLSAPLAALKKLYRQHHPGTSIALNMGASGILEEQIKEGAPADIFISASPREMNALASLGLIRAGTRRDLVSNVLVLVCPKGESGIASFKDLAKPRVQRVAIANPESVPAGVYAQEALQYFGIWNQIARKLLRAGDVRQALAYAETGDADAAVVYRTEARLSSRVRVVATAPAPSHAPIVYPAAVLRRSRDPGAALAFLDFLSGPVGQRVFQSEGFGAPPEAHSQAKKPVKPRTPSRSAGGNMGAARSRLVRGAAMEGDRGV